MKNTYCIGDYDIIEENVVWRYGMKASVIILAAGRGSRMQHPIKKQFIEVKGKSILHYTMQTFMNLEDIEELILVIQPEDEEMIQEMIKQLFYIDQRDNIKIVYGGEERYHSVYQGLQVVDSKSEAVLIHDGARPLITRDKIKEVLMVLEQDEAVILGIRAKDTLKLINQQGYIQETLPRDQLVHVQTPQGFRKSTIMDAYKEGFKQVQVLPDRLEGITDDAMMVERFTSKNVRVVQGEYNNIKITTPDDLVTMERILDLIALTEDNKL